MAWARGQRVGHYSRKAVLYVLADRADPAGVVHACTQKDIADELEMSERQVRTVLKELEPFIERVSVANGNKGRVGTQIRLRMAELPMILGAKRSKPDAAGDGSSPANYAGDAGAPVTDLVTGNLCRLPSPAQIAGDLADKGFSVRHRQTAPVTKPRHRQTTPVASRHRQSVPVDIHPPTESNIQDPIPTLQKDPLKGVPKGSLPQPVSAGEGSEAVRLFGDAAKLAGWSVPKGPHSKARQQAVRSRLREVGLEGWREQIAMAQRQGFLGGANDRGWRMGLDWFCKPANWAKIAEGAYLTSSERASAPIAANDAAALQERLARLQCERRRETGDWGLIFRDGARVAYDPADVPANVRAEFADLFPVERKRPDPPLFALTA